MVFPQHCICLKKKKIKTKKKCLINKYTIKRSEKDLFDDDYAIFFSDCLYKGICCGYSFELHRQMRTYNICLYKKK